MTRAHFPSAMIPRHLKLAASVLATAALSLSPVFAAPYADGSKVESFTARDQHEQAFTFKPAETKFLLVSHDMETGKKANAALNALGKDYLGSKKAQKDKVTVLKLNDGRVSSIAYWSPAAEPLDTLLK